MSIKFDEKFIKFGWDAGHCYSHYTQEVPEEHEEEMYDFMYNSDIECERVCVPSILLDWGIDVVVCECGCAENQLDNNRDGTDSVDDYLDEVLDFVRVVKKYGDESDAKWYQVDKIPVMVSLARKGILPAIPTHR